MEPQLKQIKCEMEISNFLESVSHDGPSLPDKKHVSKTTGKHSPGLTKDQHDDFIESGAGDVSFAQLQEEEASCSEDVMKSIVGKPGHRDQTAY